jgi:DNA anti-recombination protein RmuC
VINKLQQDMSLKEDEIDEFKRQIQKIKDETEKRFQEMKAETDSALSETNKMVDERLKHES